MRDFRHFEFGVQPQDRAALHGQLLTDPTWIDKSHADLEAELGESIVATLGSLTMLMAREPDAKLGENTLAFESDESVATQSKGGLVVASASAMELHGLDMTELRELRQRAEAAVEDKPMRFDILGAEHDTNGQQIRLATVWFDGTHYGLVRRGNRFDYTDNTGRTFSAFATDTWSVWDYNATKMSQRAAQGEDIALGTERLIMELDDSRDSEQVARILCTAGMLHSESFIFLDRARAADKAGRPTEDISYAEVLNQKALGQAFDGSRLEYFDILDDATSSIEDQTQLALVRFWFVTAGQRRFYRDFHEDETMRRQRLAHLLAGQIEDTAGAAGWDAATMRLHLLSVLDDEVERYTQAWRECFDGHSFAHANGSSRVLTDAQYPELNDDKRYVDLSTAVAMAKNPPPHDLLEDVRQFRRLGEDIEQAQIDGDDDRAEALDMELSALHARAGAPIDRYETVVNSASEGAQVGIREQLGFGDTPGLRLMIIEGILLAREIARRADKA